MKRRRVDEYRPIEATASERAVIGIILASCGAVLTEIQATGLDTEGFRDPLCSAAWASALRLQASGRPIDLVTMEADIGATDGLEFLIQCQVDAPIASHAVHHALQVISAQKQRLLAQAAHNALKLQGDGAEYPAVLKAIKQGIEEAETASKMYSRIVSAADFAAVKRPEPPEVIHGVLRAGQIGMIAAASKAGKTWGMLALGMAIASGRNWLGWSTTKGRALYVNGELPPWDLEKRIERLLAAFELTEVPPGLDIWHLRGRQLTIRDLIPDIIRRQESIGEAYHCVIPDPLYCFNLRDENSNTDQAVTMGEIGELSERSGAATMAAHHFSKGNKALSDHLDRASGAGMFARAVDSFITLTRHEADDAYTVEATTRSFAKPDSFVVRWDCPMWRRDDGLDPDALKKPPTARGGRKREHTAEDLAALLPSNGTGITFTEWKKAAKKAGFSEWQFVQQCLPEAIEKKLAVKIAGIYSRR